MKLQKILSLTVIALYSVMLTSCVKNEVDQPPANGVDPGLTANKTIAQIKAFYVSGAVTPITGDYIFKGVVIGDDRSGNIYKNIIIQDSTGGISIAIDQSNFYTSFETGRTVFVNCKGLVIGDYHKLIQMGGYIDMSSGTPAVGRIPSSLVGEHFFGGMWNQPYTTKVVSDISTLDNTLDQNIVVRLDGVHFATPCQPYADVVNQASLSRTLTDAHGNNIVVYTSNYANFAASLLPGNTGSVIGIFQVYGTGANSKQLVIRDINDVQIISGPCSTGPVGTGALMSIGAVRSLYTGLGATFVAGTKIRGVVITDKTTNCITTNNLILQDGNSGIVVRFASANTFSLNDSIEVTLSGDSLTSFSGVVQINGVSNASATLLGTGSITPRVATIAQINAAGTSWESTLVKIVNANLTTGTTYSGSVTLTDASSGTLTLYTRSAATFSGTTHPATATSITGFLTTFSGGPELSLRNLSDVQ